MYLRVNYHTSYPLIKDLLWTDRSYKASLIVTVIINMSFVERFQNEPWFALANAAVFGSLGYLFLDKILCKNKSSKPSHSTPSEY